jgi:predicted dehydrogenase
METGTVMTQSPAPLRFGMIGFGALGLVHSQRLSAIAGVQVAALSDPSETAMRNVATELKAAQPLPHFTDYREMLASVALDAVCISSPNRLHVEQLLASVECGLHVLCEKPLSLYPAEVTQVVQATQRADRTVAIAYQSRYRHDARILRHALQSGQWGRISSVNIFSSEDWITPNVGTWRHDPARCPGGFFADANGHQLDLLFWVTNMAATDIHATIEQRGTPIPIATWGDARLIPQGSSAPADVGNAPLLNFNFVGDARHWHEEITIHTERADFVMRDTHLLWTDGSAPLGPFPKTEMTAEGMPDLPDTAFAWAIRQQQPVLSPPETVWPVLTFTREALAAAGYGLPASP